MDQSATELPQRCRWHSASNLVPDFVCQKKGYFGIAQLRFTPIVGVPHIDSIRIQLYNVLRPHGQPTLSRD